MGNTRHEVRTAIKGLLKGWVFDEWSYARPSRRRPYSRAIHPGRSSRTGPVAVLIALEGEIDSPLTEIIDSVRSTVAEVNPSSGHLLWTPPCRSVVRPWWNRNQFGYGTVRHEEVADAPGTWRGLGQRRVSLGPSTRQLAAVVVTDRPLGAVDQPWCPRTLVVVPPGHSDSSGMDEWLQEVRGLAGTVAVLDVNGP